jgi:ribonuclease E
MSNKMLIDATHPEETRVVTLQGNRVEDFDFESASKKPLRGNIYLAKVTRVEPSLQAAFVDYGGNRHGFLAFSEIHPDYYQIPVADRQELLRQEQAERAAEEEADNASRGETADSSEQGEEREESEGGGEDDEGNGEASSESVSSVGAEDALEEVPERRPRRARSYKIQEVIRRRQVLLVQVVKEERGNKGAALTTYLSLAGRYSVLMPNTARGGGISRKIASADDRKRLKEVAGELDVPEGMGVIVRTAGAKRTKTEIKRDFEYLLRLWENVRTLTLQSNAPCLVYEEGNLVKRAIRDLYTKDIEEIVVSGEESYREAKDFMRMLMPSHAKNVKLYKGSKPLFVENNAEAQLEALFNQHVTLRSGGYIVINQTEALVAIDVNSGRATREHNIEDTALKTNLEAAEEIARQLRLRDLAGLIVIDFIDMDERRNNRSVEKKLKDCLNNDRARLQIGRISSFGLLEMSRQRTRSGVLEGSTEICKLCHGTGLLRSTESVALHVLRSVEQALERGMKGALKVRLPTAAALYILNNKRPYLRQLEQDFGTFVTFEGDDTLLGVDHAIEEDTTIEVPRAVEPRRFEAAVEVEEPEAEAEAEPEPETESAAEAVADETSEERSEGGQRKRRRRRRRRGRENGHDAGETTQEMDAAEDDSEAENEPDSEPNEAEMNAGEAGSEQSEGQTGRRRGRRGGRRRRSSQPEAAEGSEATSEQTRSAPEIMADHDEAPAGREGQEAEPAAADMTREDEPEDVPFAEPEMREVASPADSAAPLSPVLDEEHREPVEVAPETYSEAQADEPEEHRAPESLTGDFGDEVQPQEFAADEAQVADGADVDTGEEEGSDVQDAQSAPATTVAPPRPRRRGWWQRRLTGR